MDFRKEIMEYQLEKEKEKEQLETNTMFSCLNYCPESNNCTINNTEPCIDCKKSNHGYKGH